MKISEVTEKVNNKNPGIFTDCEITELLNELDKTIFLEVINRFEDGKTFTPYTDTQASLLVDEPYSNIYVPFIESKLYYKSGEITRHNYALSVFDTNYKSFVAWYIKNHEYKRVKRKLF